MVDMNFRCNEGHTSYTEGVDLDEHEVGSKICVNVTAS